jgi:hypothetical protein
MQKAGIGALAFLILTGCASAEKLAAQDDARCKSYGFNIGTEEYGKCRYTLDRERAQKNTAALNAAANALGAYSESMRAKNSQQPTMMYAPPAYVPPPTIYTPPVYRPPVYQPAPVYQPYRRY